MNINELAAGLCASLLVFVTRKPHVIPREYNMIIIYILQVMFAS